MTVAELCAVQLGIQDPVECGTTVYNALLAWQQQHPSSSISHQHQLSSSGVVFGGGGGGSVTGSKGKGGGALPLPPPRRPPAVGKACGGVAVPAAFQDAMATTNSFRAIHGAPCLTWDPALAAQANSWLTTLLADANQTGNLVLQHGDVAGVGQNLYATTGAAGSAPVAAVRAWAGEEAAYNYDAPGFSEATGHFTQLVWKDTTRVGCAVGTGNVDTVVVCDYSPPGNMLTYGPDPAALFRTNVLPATGR